MIFVDEVKILEKMMARKILSHSPKLKFQKILKIGTPENREKLILKARERLLYQGNL